eukprot:TRINITY_DN8277_c0_g1_i2.p1 TRINITY_DN8277_c0_g1~~TRINITY_DN8277_c0_g1_i2.p1  ORF type:complete len:244 (-),score=36.21 TRINITY_DN8277_c0_g1_i2:283-1014(-)
MRLVLQVLSAASVVVIAFLAGRLLDSPSSKQTSLVPLDAASSRSTSGDSPDDLDVGKLYAEGAFASMMSSVTSPITDTLLKIWELCSTIKSAFDPNADLETVERVFHSFLVAMVGIIGLLLCILIPALLLAWWLLSNPDVPHAQLAFALGHLDFMLKPLDKVLTPMLAFVCKVMEATGIGGEDVKALLEQDERIDAAVPAKRVLLGLLILNVILSIVSFFAILNAVVVIKVAKSAADGLMKRI